MGNKLWSEVPPLSIKVAFSLTRQLRRNGSTRRLPYVLAFFMVYLLFAAVQCARPSIAAARQGGTAYHLMWFSIVIAYGGEFPDMKSLSSLQFPVKCTLSLVSWNSIRGTCLPASYPNCCLSPTYINILTMYVKPPSLFCRYLLISQCQLCICQP
jgi:hypothetical protein